MGSLFIGRNIIKVWFIILVFGFCFLSVYEVNAGECVETFSWVSSSESDLVGYKIYYGQTSGGPYPGVVNIDNPVPVDGRINGTVTGLDCGQQYYFVCVAVNDAGIESSYSQQMDITSLSSVPGVPTNLNVIEK